MITKPEIANMLGQVVAQPHMQKKMADLGYKLDSNEICKLVNQTYQQLMEATVPNTEKPYWIIVSDEGHANIPHKHFVKAEAEKEAQRLTELKPGITFTVFEAKSSLFTPKADTKKTEYSASFLGYYPWNPTRSCF